jgi:hypothetical protein
MIDELVYLGIRLFLIVSADGQQMPLLTEVAGECIKKRSFVPISQLINSLQNNNA